MENATLDTEKLTQYLIETQKGKIYMCFDPNTQTFKREQLNEDLYTVTCVTENAYNGNTVLCETKSGMHLAVLLRFKNGNGVQFPALQIKASSGKKKHT